MNRHAILMACVTLHWGDERLVTAVNTYHGGRQPLVVMADGEGNQGLSLGSHSD